MKRIAIKIFGRVQGVFFRHTARTHAERLELGGWVRNEADGSVTAVVEGDEAALEQLLGWCRKGPPLARVDNVQVTWGEATGEFGEFEIR